jgi:hypothetical protein
MNEIMSAFGGGGTVSAMLVGVFLVLGYFAVLIDRRREGSPSRDDNQVGIKLVLYGVAIVAMLMVVGGLQRLFEYVLGGFKPIEVLKQAGAALVAGGFVALGVIALALPRTNARAMPQVERYAWGLIALYTGITAVFALHLVVEGVFMSQPWAQIAGFLAQLFAYGVVTILAIARLGRLSSWGAATSAGYAGQQGYQQQGYQQGGSYPQQGYSGQQGYGGQQGGGGYPR